MRVFVGEVGGNLEGVFHYTILRTKQLVYIDVSRPLEAITNPSFEKFLAHASVS
jgi:hypothetical protein